MSASRSLLSQHKFYLVDGDSTFIRNLCQLLTDYEAHVTEYSTFHEYLDKANPRKNAGNKGNFSEFQQQYWLHWQT